MKNIFAFLWRYKIYTIIALIILAIIGTSCWKKNNSGVVYTYDKVTRQTITDLVSESGNLQLEGQANITSPIEGVINQIYVENGDYVGADSALFSVKSNATDIEKAAAYASLLAAQSNLKIARQADGTHLAAVDTAKATLASAEINYHNIYTWYTHGYKNVATNRHYTQTEVDGAKASVDAAEQGLANAKQALTDTSVAVEAAQAAADSAQETYDSKTIYTVKANRAGTVSNLSANIGDKASALTTTSPIMIIAGSDKLTFKTQINENEVAKLKIDQAANVTIDAVKEKIFKANITEIDTIGTNISGVITFNVYFALNETDETMRSGMSGNVDVVVTEHKDVLTVSNAAIKPYQDGKAVQVIDTTKPKKGKTPILKYVPVKTGIKGPERTEILEGLTEGTEIIINNTGNQFKSNIFGG